MKEKISVIIPTHNRAGSILASVESVLSQDYEDLEVIVVDDASEDDTGVILSGIGDARFRYHKEERNGGASKARNTGVGLASYELIAFQDSDDIWRPDKLSAMMDHRSRHPREVLIYSPFLITLPDGEKRKVPEWGDQKELSGDLFARLLCSNVISTQTMLTTQTVFHKAGGFDESLPALEDWDLAIRISKLGSIGYVDRVLVDVAASEGGLSSSVRKYFDARCRMIVKYREDMERLGLFDKILMELFHKAEEGGILEEVKKMLMLYLSREGN